MTRQSCLLSLLASLAVASGSHAAENVNLDHAVVLADSSEPSFVRYGIEDLAGYLIAITGNEVPIVAPSDAAHPVQIIVGTAAVRKVLPDCIPDATLGPEGYLVKAVSNGSAASIVVTGSTPHGTKTALGVLMKAIQVEARSAFVPDTLNVTGKPALAKRGMHFNGWAFNYPYSFRSWRENDWQRYLDLLAYQGVNLFFLWPFIEIMPVPLSPEDQEYLEECRRVVDYAQQKHGMEVWLMQCTNRVAKDRCGVADPRLRPYWRPSQEDLNPGKPEDFQAIMDSREAMYRIISNADGVCNIDSDPGFYPGSPLGDYVRVLQGCRALLDRLNTHGKQTKLINWMLWGWGRKAMVLDGLVEHQRDTLQDIKDALPEPWELICSQFGFLPPDQHFFLPVCQESNTLEKAVFLPYGVIEFEPSYPKTNVEIDGIRDTFSNQVDAFPQLAGAMGNMQTPLLQFPDAYYFAACMFDADYRKRSESDVMLDLAAYLYPEQKELVAACFLAMKEADPAEVDALANRLDAVIREDKLGRAGLFARRLFPDYGIVARALLPQLRLRAAQERLVHDVASDTPKEACERLLHDYFDAYLTWDLTHGWHGLWGWDKWPSSDERFRAVAEKLRASLGSQSEVNACLDRVVRALSKKYDPKILEDGCAAPWRK